MIYSQVSVGSAYCGLETFYNKVRLSKPMLNCAGKWVGADRDRDADLAEWIFIQCLDTS